MRKLRGLLGWLGVVVVAMCFASTARADDAFSGQPWQVHCTPGTSTVALGGDAFDDGFLFENGNFSAQAYMIMGFTPAAYTIDSTGKFTATLTSTDRGTIVWHGRASGNSIYGSITWTKPDGSIFKYHYTGTPVVQTSDTSSSDTGSSDSGSSSSDSGSSDSGSTDTTDTTVTSGQ
jgi:hypothetical protein